MTEFIIATGSALWLGILTSISPCPLATNIAAISYIGRRVGSSRQVFLTGLLYTLGRTLAYLGLAAVLVASVLSVPQVSLFLQKYMHLILGPILIIVGMFLLGLVQLSMGGKGMSEGLKRRVDAMGVWGASCSAWSSRSRFARPRPRCSSAAWSRSRSKSTPASRCRRSTASEPRCPSSSSRSCWPPALESVGKAYKVLGKIEWWARMLTGWVFILLGVYFSLKHVFQVI